MTRQPYPWLALVALFLLAAPPPAKGNMSDIAIVGADEVVTYKVATQHDAHAPSSDTPPGFRMERADSNTYLKLAPPDDSLSSLLNDIGPCIILAHADKTYTMSIQYHKGLASDATPPAVHVTPPSEKSPTMVGWSSSDFITGTLHCGLQSGVYTTSFASTLYSRDYITYITKLSGRTGYFCKVTVTDREGITATSEELRIKPWNALHVYMPLVKR